jgi:hypothetical protein
LKQNRRVTENTALGQLLTLAGHETCKSIAFYWLRSARTREIPGTPIAQNEPGEHMTSFWKKALLGAALLAPIAMAPAALQADDRRRYHDSNHNDDHQWNNHEDRAYRMWVKENHRKYRSFDRVREEDRQNYWRWRHDHSDTVLRINIR